MIGVGAAALVMMAGLAIAVAGVLLARNRPAAAWALAGVGLLQAAAPLLAMPLVWWESGKSLEMFGAQESGLRWVVFAAASTGAVPAALAILAADALLLFAVRQLRPRDA